MTLNANQNWNLNCNKNRNNNGNRGRYRKPRVLEDLENKSIRDFRRARESSAFAKQETGSGGRGRVGAAGAARPLPVKVRD